MASDPDDRKPKPAGKAKAKKLSQKEQSERFKEAARTLGVDESGEAFERAIKAILPPGSPPTRS